MLLGHAISKKDDWQIVSDSNIFSNSGTKSRIYKKKNVYLELDNN